MIRSFAHKGLKRLYEADDRSKLAADLVDRIATVLAALDEAVTVEDLNRPSFRLHQLKGDLKGLWSVTVRAIGGSSSASRTATPMTSISSTIIEGMSECR